MGQLTRLVARRPKGRGEAGSQAFQYTLPYTGRQSLLRSVQFPMCVLEEGAPLAAREDCRGAQNWESRCA